MLTEAIILAFAIPTDVGWNVAMVHQESPSGQAILNYTENATLLHGLDVPCNCSKATIWRSPADNPTNLIMEKRLDLPPQPLNPAEAQIEFFPDGSGYAWTSGLFKDYANDRDELRFTSFVTNSTVGLEHFISSGPWTIDFVGLRYYRVRNGSGLRTRQIYDNELTSGYWCVPKLGNDNSRIALHADLHRKLLLVLRKIKDQPEYSLEILDTSSYHVKNVTSVETVDGSHLTDLILAKIGQPLNTTVYGTPTSVQSRSVRLTKTAHSFAVCNEKDNRSSGGGTCIPLNRKPAYFCPGSLVMTDGNCSEPLDENYRVRLRVVWFKPTQNGWAISVYNNNKNRALKMSEYANYLRSEWFDPSELQATTLIHVERAEPYEDDPYNKRYQTLPILPELAPNATLRLMPQFSGFVWTGEISNPLMVKAYNFRQNKTIDWLDLSYFGVGDVLSWDIDWMRRIVYILHTGDPFFSLRIDAVEFANDGGKLQLDKLRHLAFMSWAWDDSNRVFATLDSAGTKFKLQAGSDRQLILSLSVDPVDHRLHLLSSSSTNLVFSPCGKIWTKSFDTAKASQFKANVVDDKAFGLWNDSSFRSYPEGFIHNLDSRKHVNATLYLYKSERRYKNLCPEANCSHVCVALPKPLCLCPHKWEIVDNKHCFEYVQTVALSLDAGSSTVNTSTEQQNLTLRQQQPVLLQCHVPKLTPSLEIVYRIDCPTHQPALEVFPLRNNSLTHLDSKFNGCQLQCRAVRNETIYLSNPIQLQVAQEASTILPANTVVHSPAEIKIWHRNPAKVKPPQGYWFPETKNILSFAAESLSIYSIGFSPPQINFYKETNTSSPSTVVDIPQTTINKIQFAVIRADPSKPQVIWTHSPHGHLWLTNVETKSSIPLKKDFGVIDMDVDWDRQMVFGVSEVNRSQIIILDFKAPMKESRIFASEPILSIGVTSNTSHSHIYYMGTSGRICRQIYDNDNASQGELEVVPALQFSTVRRKSLVVQNTDWISWVSDYFGEVSFVESLMTSNTSKMGTFRYFTDDFANAIVRLPSTPKSPGTSELPKEGCSDISLLNGQCVCPWSPNAENCPVIWIHLTGTINGLAPVFTSNTNNRSLQQSTSYLEKTSYDPELVSIDGAGQKYCSASTTTHPQTTSLICSSPSSKYTISAGSRILQTVLLNHESDLNIISLNDNRVQINNVDKNTTWTLFRDRDKTISTSANVVLDTKNWILFFEKAGVVEMVHLDSMVVRPFLKEFVLEKVVPDRLTLDSDSTFLYWIHGQNQLEVWGRNYTNWNTSAQIKFWENDKELRKLQFFNGFLYWIEKTQGQKQDQLVIFNIPYRSKQVFIRSPPDLMSISSFILQTEVPQTAFSPEAGTSCSHFSRGRLSSNKSICWCPHEKPLLASNGRNCTDPTLHIVTTTSIPNVLTVSKSAPDNQSADTTIEALEQSSVFAINPKAQCWLTYPEKHLKCLLSTNPKGNKSNSLPNTQNPTFSLSPTSDLILFNTGNETTETLGCLTMANITTGQNLTFPCLKEDEGNQFAFDFRRKLAVWCSNRDRRIKFHPLNAQLVSYEPSFEERNCKEDARCTSLALDATNARAYFIHGKQIRSLEYRSKKPKPPLATLHEMAYSFANSLSYDGDGHLFWVGGFSSSGEFVDMITVPEDPKDSVASVRVRLDKTHNFKIVQVQAELKIQVSETEDLCGTSNCHGFCFPAPGSWWTLDNPKCYCSDQQTDYTHCSKLFDSSASTNIHEIPVIQNTAEPLEPPGGDFKLLMIIIGVCASLIVLALVIVAIRFRRRQSSQEENYKQALAVFLEGDEGSANQMENAAERSYYVPFTMIIPPEDIDLHDAKQLGSGQFGAVFLAKYKNEPAAIKMVKSGKDKEQMMEFLKEIKIMAYIGEHSNIVQMYGAVTHSLAEGSVLVVLELCNHGDLESYLRKHKADYVQVEEDENAILRQSSEPIITFNNLVDWSRQIAQGLSYLQEKQVVHGDLATRNVLVFEDNVVKVSDFGFSRKTYGKQYTKSNKHTPLPFRWAAPETLDQMVFSSKTDVWSYGVTIWEIFTLGNCPFVQERWDLTFSTRLKEGMRLERPQLAVDEIYDQLMMHCWQVNPDDRPDFQQICAFWDALIVGEFGVQGHVRALPNMYHVAGEYLQQ